jgi:cytosine/adenosine deaminase-related metal-dependent hydrolase
LDIDAIVLGGLKKTPTEFLDEVGLLNEDTIVAHGVWLSEEDARLLRTRNAAVVLCPSSNEMLNVGKAPVKMLVEHGLKIGIGTDSLASNPDIDLFSELRKVNELALHQGLKLKPFDLIKMLTMDGAEILGLDEYLGCMKAGKLANLIAIDISNYKLDSFKQASKRDKDENIGNPPVVDLTDEISSYIVNKISKSSIVTTILNGAIVYNRI